LIKSIDSLFSERAKCIINYNTALNKFYDSGSNLLQFELNNRTQKFRDLEKRWETKIVSMKSTPYIEKITINNDIANASVYEWTLFNWVWRGNIITSGFGVNHDMTWTLKNGNWIVIKDSYDEGPLTGVRSPDYAESVLKENGKNTSLITTISTLNSSSYYYDRAGAASYADNYVNHSFNYVPSNNHYDPTMYNPNYRDYYATGNGDCANYVSQSIHEGGLIPFVNPYINNSSSWWYNNCGTSSTSDDYCSDTWACAPCLYNFVIEKNWGQVVSNGNSLVKGDLVFYDWRYSGDTAGTDHVTIVTFVQVDYTGQTTLPLVDSHSWDYYHVPWNYGYSSTLHYPMHMNNYLNGG
ncbi:MAG: amidase domain-containing protein, partial [Caldisericota bacterium]|nr:amidase domain-containing protein [Caldisericota bacterium]